MSLKKVSLAVHVRIIVAIILNFVLLKNKLGDKLIDLIYCTQFPLLVLAFWVSLNINDHNVTLETFLELRIPIKKFLQTTQPKSKENDLAYEKLLCILCLNCLKIFLSDFFMAHSSHNSHFTAVLYFNFV